MTYQLYRNTTLGNTLQESLDELVQDGSRLTEFWLQANIAHLYPALWSYVKKFLIVFPSSYLVERRFSVVTGLITKKRNRLDIEKRGDLRLHLTSIEPDVKKLAVMHQLQASH